MLLSFILCNFLVRMLKCFLKKKYFFCPQKVEKTTPKICILMAVGSFFPCSPDCPKQPRTSFPFYNFFYPTISGGISVTINLKKVKLFLATELCNLSAFLGHFCNQVIQAGNDIPAQNTVFVKGRSVFSKIVLSKANNGENN